MTVTFNKHIWLPTNRQFCHVILRSSELQIRRCNRDSLKIIFLIPQWKPMLWPLIRTVSPRRFYWRVTKYVDMTKYWKLSQNYPLCPFLFGALNHPDGLHWVTRGLSTGCTVWPNSRAFACHQCHIVWSHIMWLILYDNQKLGTPKLYMLFLWSDASKRNDIQKEWQTV